MCGCPTQVACLSRDMNLQRKQQALKAKERQAAEHLQQVEEARRAAEAARADERALRMREAWAAQERAEQEAQRRIMYFQVRGQTPQRDGCNGLHQVVSGGAAVMAYKVRRHSGASCPHRWGSSQQCRIGLQPRLPFTAASCLLFRGFVSAMRWQQCRRWC